MGREVSITYGSDSDNDDYYEPDERFSDIRCNNVLGDYTGKKSAIQIIGHLEELVEKLEDADKYQRSDIAGAIEVLSYALREMLSSLEDTVNIKYD